MILDDRDQYMTKQENLEQSRILWIVLSALTVIAIVIAAGIFFFFPSAEGNSGQSLMSSLSTEKQGRDFDHVEYVRNADGYPEMVDPEAAEEEFAVESENETEAPAVTVKENETVEAAEEESNVVEVTNEPVKTVEEIAVTPVVKKQETMKVSVTVYWIQVGSYNDLTKAEEVRNYLFTKDISSEIQTKAVNGKTYYRVRIGAFQSKGEADRFLDPIKNMKNFEESYVVQTTMIKEVPVN
jgi:DedD protein